jgi:hypothetical protein
LQSWLFLAFAAFEQTVFYFNSSTSAQKHDLGYFIISPNEALSNKQGVLNTYSNPKPYRDNLIAELTNSNTMMRK